MSKASKRNLARRNKTALEPRIQKSKWILHYRYYFLNKLNQNKTSMAKAMGPFRDSKTPFLAHRALQRFTDPLLGSPGPGLKYRLNPPLIGPGYECKTICFANVLVFNIIIMYWYYGTNGKNGSKSSLNNICWLSWQRWYIYMWHMFHVRVTV